MQDLIAITTQGKKHIELRNRTNKFNLCSIVNCKEHFDPKLGLHFRLYRDSRKKLREKFWRLFPRENFHEGDSRGCDP